jgi:hypothetical protein
MKFRGMIYSENIFPRSTNVFVPNYTNYITGYTKVCFSKGQEGQGDTADSNPYQIGRNNTES